MARWELPSVASAQRIIGYVNDGTQARQPAQRCQQSAFESLLRRHCEQHPLIDCRWGWSLDSLQQHCSCVDASFSVTGDATRALSVRAAWLVGRDGASSRVRRSAGIELHGIGSVADLTMIHFRSRDSSNMLRYGRFWHVYLASGAAIIAQDERDPYTAHIPVQSETDDAEAPDALVERALGVRVEIDEILLRSRWTPRSLVAARYRDRASDASVISDPSVRHQLHDHLLAERGENEAFGIELDVRNRESPVILADGTDEPPWDPMTVTPSTWPGCRAPHVFLEDGSSIVDSFGSGFVLIDFLDGGAAEWERAAKERLIPFSVRRVADPAVASIYERPRVLVRPDGHVAWRGDRDGADPGAVLDFVTGRSIERLK